MRYERGEILGLFCGELGIRPNARIAIAPSRNGLRIWDLSTNKEFILNIKGNTLNVRSKVVPEDCAFVFAESDQALLARIADRTLSPWSEDRETIASELRFRDLAYDESPHFPLPLLLSHLVHHFNPIHLLRRAPRPSATEERLA